MNRPAFNRVIFILSLVGLFIAGYLTMHYVQNADIPCGPVAGGCNEVATDTMAWGLGIGALKSVPTPAIGLLMYGALAALSFARVVTSSAELSRRASAGQWVLALAGVLVSAGLTWREAVIHHWCVWCVGSAAVILLIFITATAERFGTVPPPAARREVA